MRLTIVWYIIQSQNQSQSQIYYVPPVVHNLLHTRDWKISWKTIFPLMGVGGMFSEWFKFITFIVHLFLLLLHQFHLRSSGIRSQSLVIPVLHDKGIREERKLTHIFITKWRNTHNSYSPCSVTGHMVIAGIFNYLFHCPFHIPFALSTSLPGEVKKGTC